MFRSDVDGYLVSLSRSTCQTLFNEIFSLPTEDLPTVTGRLAILPNPALPIPREKPIPTPKAPTKWEEFAKSKGIVKQKKSRMEWDERTQSYAPRWGYKRANDDSQEWAIEHKSGDDPSIDPWTRMSQEKKSRVEKNKKQAQRNLQAAQGKRLPGTIDLTTAVQASKQKAETKKQQKGNKKHHVDVS